MSVYVLAQLTITDRDCYLRYVGGFMPTLKPFGGVLLVADEAPETIEDQWSGDKVVLIRFPDEPSFRGWIHSPEYLAISGARRAGARGPVLLLQGVCDRNGS